MGASSRLRLYQYLPYLKNNGLEVTIAPLLGDDYIRGIYGGKFSKLLIFKSYITRLINISRASKFDLIWVEKEMLPWIPSCIELALLPATVPLVVDYDDAIFHRYDQHKLSIVRRLLGRKIDLVMKRANLVIAGNEYLAKRAHDAGASWVEIIPTVLDTNRYMPSYFTDNDIPIIGWIGSPSTTKFIQKISTALKEVTAIRRVQVVAVGANIEQISDLPIKTLLWTEASEVADIQHFDIGIMPLTDAPFERGKCGYKLIQYMACGKPVVASPVGVNSKIVSDGEDGFLASTHEEWVSALTKLIDNPRLRETMGSKGRQKVEVKYSLQISARRLLELFSLVNSR